MDNITHSLIGLTIGEAVAVHRKKARLPIWIASAVANNLPDLDLIQTSFFFPGQLGYMLHHRGHTHTLLAAPLLSAILLLLAWLLFRKRPGLPWKEMAFVIFLGGVFHLLADSWNSYGTHPFWPVNNRWFYGDMLFIVEPWIWAVVLPTISLACTSRWGKGTCYTLIIFILGLSWYHEAVSAAAATALTLGTALSFLAQWKIPSRGARVAISIGACLVLLLSMFGISQSLHRKHGAPGAELALHPFPANPLCWSALKAELTDTEYRAESFTLTLFPGLLPAEKCPRLAGPATTAPLRAPSKESTAELHRIGEFVALRAEFEQLSADCRINAFLRFARIPFWKKFYDGWIVGDLRFDREETLGFTEIFLPTDPVDCPRGVPPWIGRFHPESL